MVDDAGSGESQLHSGIPHYTRDVMKWKTVTLMKQRVKVVVTGKAVFISNLFIRKRA